MQTTVAPLTSNVGEHQNGAVPDVINRANQCHRRCGWLWSDPTGMKVGYAQGQSWGAGQEVCLTQ